MILPPIAPIIAPIIIETNYTMPSLRSITDFIGTLVPANRASYTAPAAASYSVRGATLSDEDLNTLKHVLFGEISNRATDRQQLEARTIVNTALNRIPQYAANGRQMSLSQVLSEPKQYQAYGGTEYQRIKTGQLKPTDDQKVKAIDSVLGELKTGKFDDNTGGAVFYSHDPQGRIKYAPGTLYKQKRTISDLAGQ